MKRGKILIFTTLTLILVLCSFLAAAQDEDTGAAEEEEEEAIEQMAYDWLVGKSGTDGNYNSRVFDTAMAVLAFNALGDTVSEERSMGWIEARKNIAQACWPGTSCKVQDTAMTLLAMNAAGSDLKADVEDWLINAQNAGLKAGEWLLEVSTGAAGTCKVTYTLKNVIKEQEIKVNYGYFPGCGNTTFLDLNTCLGTSGLVDSNPGIVLSVDCSSLGSSPIITLLYRAEDSFYLLETVSAATADIRVNNGCYGKKFKGGCEVESSLYANWALEEVKSGSNTILYLKEKADSSNVVHNALMYLITGGKKYASALKSLAKTDGSWNKKAFDTALAVYALGKEGTFPTEVENGISWLREHQKTDGSWDSDVKATAMVLYAVFPQASVETIEAPAEPSCTDGLKNQDERGIDCGGVCENITGDDCCNNEAMDEGEDGIDCGGDCYDCEEGAVEDLCNYDGVCDFVDGENIGNCDSDCDPSLCTNGVWDEDNYEEDVDCGGPCGVPCGEEDACNYDGYCDPGENAINCYDDCCGDDYCDPDYESESSCAKDCVDGGEPKEVTDECKTDADCDYDDDCADVGCRCVEGECQPKCASDEDCDDGYVCEGEECVLEEEGKFPWIIVAIVLLLLGVGGFLFYKKFLSPPPKKEGGGGLGGFGFGGGEGGEGGGEGLFGGLPQKPK